MPNKDQHYDEIIDSLFLSGTSKTDKLARLSELANPEALNKNVLDKLTSAIRAGMPEESASFYKSFAARPKLIDCCGTGGSGLSHFNTSTTVAFILAAADIQVAKFGNRAASSQSGSFDLLDALGIGEPLSMASLADLLQETNLAFLFAPQFYPQLAPLAPLRKELARKTIFNYVGPLLNPANPPYRLLGVPSPQAQALIAAHLSDRVGTKQAFIVTADSGLDEIDVHSSSTILKVKRSDEGNGSKDFKNSMGGGVITEKVSLAFLQNLGQELDGKFDRLLGARDNAEIFKALLQGQLNNHNYYHALVCVNAGAGLQAAELVNDLETGYQTAAKLLESGLVLAKYNQYVSNYKIHLTTHAGVL